MPFSPTLIITGMEGGMNTHDLPDNLQLSESPRIIGMDFTAKTVKKALGYTQYGTETETEPGFTLYNHRGIGGLEILIKTVADKIKFYDSISGAWQLITTTTFTSGARFFMASFNGFLYFCDGVGNFSRWKSTSWSTLVNPVTSGSTTIELATGTGSRFAASGSGLIESDTFSWTGVSSDQLTGVTGITSNHAAGARVIVAADTSTYSTAPKGSVGCIFRNRTFIRDDLNPNFWYFSKLADNTSPEDDLANFSVAGSGTGDAGFYPMPAPILGVKTFISASNTSVQLLFCADGIAYAFTVTDSGTTTIATAIPFKVFSADLASKGAVTDFENEIILIDNFNTIRTLGYQDVNTPANTRRLSDIIQPTLDDLSTETADAYFFNRKAYFQLREGDGDINNFTVVKDTNPDAFSVYTHWQINALCEHNNELYGLSSFDARVFKMLNGRSADDSVIQSFYSTAHLDFGVPLIMKQLQKIRIKGYITVGCVLPLKVYYDESTSPMEFTISGDDNNITTPDANVAVGTVTFGSSVFGGTSNVGTEIRQFTAEINMRTFTNFDTMYITIENAQKDVDFELSKILLFAEVQDADLFKPAQMLNS